VSFLDGRSIWDPSFLRGTLITAISERLVGTVYESWEETGFFWEQYSDETGKGKRSRAFTGWTATVILFTGLQFGDETRGSGEVSDMSSGVMLSLVGAISFRLFSLPR
jgi:hypothetical protein